MLEALKRSSSTENFISQSSSSEECLHTNTLYSQGDRLQYNQQERFQYNQGERVMYSQEERLQYSQEERPLYIQDEKLQYSQEERPLYSQEERPLYSQDERLQYSLESVGSMATSEEEGELLGKTLKHPCFKLSTKTDVLNMFISSSGAQFFYSW